jgi:lysophospholipase L1-like esterase
LDAAKNAGYRWYLQQALAAAGRRYCFHGSQARGDIDTSYSSLHDGTAGITQANLLTQITVAVMPIGPEFLLYLCGLNDISAGDSPAVALISLQTNLDAIFAASYRLRAVVLGQLLQNGNGALNSKVNAFNAGLPAIAAAYTAAGKKVVIAPLNAAVPYNTDNFGGDTTHPNATGYQLMAINGWLPTLLTLM